MKLLILTQAVDRADPVLGFFHRWVEEIATQYEEVTVICLKKGEHDLAHNTRVLSLGKEGGKSVFKYVFRFYAYIWKERKNYDAVFVHMNQEYALLGAVSWRLMGKSVYLWRNHAKGGFLTRLAVMVSKKVFYTSPQSFTARFRRAVRMPVGIDTNFFRPDAAVAREPRTILFLGRIAPVKKVLEFVEWLKGQDFARATIAGAALPQDRAYETEVRKRLEDLDLSAKVEWTGSVGPEEARRLYRTHEVYANFTPPGSFDKTIFEAAACGARLVTRNPDAEASALGEDNSLESLVRKLKKEMS